MYRSSEHFDAVPTVLDNTVPAQPHCVTGCGHSMDTATLVPPFYFAEPFDPDDGCISAPLVSAPDTGSGARLPHVPVDTVQPIGGVQMYSELQTGGQVTASTEPPPSFMRACPSAASMLSYARSDTDSSANGPTCRICDSTGDGSNRLISPCRCSGTSKFVHEQCLNVSSHLLTGK